MLWRIDSIWHFTLLRSLASRCHPQTWWHPSVMIRRNLATLSPLQLQPPQALISKFPNPEFATLMEILELSLTPVVFVYLYVSQRSKKWESVISLLLLLWQKKCKLVFLLDNPTTGSISVVTIKNLVNQIWICIRLSYKPDFLLI